MDDFDLDMFAQEIAFPVRVQRAHWGHIGVNYRPIPESAWSFIGLAQTERGLRYILLAAQSAMRRQHGDAGHVRAIDARGTPVDQLAFLRTTQLQNGFPARTYRGRTT